MDDKIQREHWDVTKKLFAIVQLQQARIEDLYARYGRLIDLLRSEAGLEERPADEKLKAQEKLKAELAELERMFGNIEEGSR